MESIIMCTIFGVFILLSFMLGVRVGQMKPNEKIINIPSPKKKSKEEMTEEEKEEMKLIEDLEKYDGYLN